MRRNYIPVWFVALATFGSGIINVYSVLGPSLHYRVKLLEAFFPLEFIHIARFLSLLIGFALVVSAINIYRRKRRAFYFVFSLSCLSIIFHLTKGLDYEEASVSLVLLAILTATREHFTVKSSVPRFGTGVLRFATAALLALAYGIVGFWLLDRRHFDIDFHLGDAARETWRFLTFSGDPTLIPRTRYARWFLDSLSLMTVTAIVYSLYALFRPALYVFGTLPRERAFAKAIVERHGRSALDFFKFWPDKSFFFSPSRRSFIAYRVGRHFAVALADPTGPEEETEEIIARFAEFCRENDWGIGFHQTLPDFLPLYEKLDFRKLKVGDDAIVDLARFSLEGKERKSLRHGVHKLEDEGVRFQWLEPPIPDALLAKIKGVSDEWLGLPGRRERQFTLGAFNPGYVRSTPVATAAAVDGTILAFANQIPSYRAGEATIDLMRHRSNAPPGTMDYLLIKLFVQLRSRGFVRFNLGMAPMSGFREHEAASVEEKAIHAFFQHLNFLFSYRGLKRYKAKFADSWEPRYAIYRTPLDLPRMAMALSSVSEIHRERRHKPYPFEEEGTAIEDMAAGEP
ncbi:MAG TPA: phosphatidylglycerol lysyltransferase domain-containing protein [Candidatus Bathyarchaeia archaeon]|nr:phosphatidylglycerol lysyltransferase domain-containing protein [Candidatus Bathyarchaeia archaeon]